MNSSSSDGTSVVKLFFAAMAATNNLGYGLSGGQPAVGLR